MDILVRKAHQEDLRAIQDLNYQLFLWDKQRDPGLNLDWPYQEEGESYFKKRISEAPGVCFVAELSGQIVGYVAGRVNKHIDSTETIMRGELENIYIEESARNKGVGRILVQNLMNWAETQGAKSMFVTAYTSNVAAVKFYETCGFSPFATKLEMRLGGTHA